MKKYTIKVGEVFTQKKADELIEYLKVRDNDLEELENYVNHMINEQIKDKMHAGRMELVRNKIVKLLNR